jgi:hypothetical protein
MSIARRKSVSASLRLIENRRKRGDVGGELRVGGTKSALADRDRCR